MTPFGEALRRLRSERGLSQKMMARALGVSPAYLSALEHGRRGKPGWQFVQRVIGYFNIIWDDAEHIERLAALSDPRVVVDTTDLSSTATLLANRIARDIRHLNAEAIEALAEVLSVELERCRRSDPREDAVRKAG